VAEYHDAAVSGADPIEARPGFAEMLLGAVAEFDKAMTVAKLRGARERKRRQAGKCEGRKSHVELRPDVVRLHRASPLNGERRSLRKISSELAAMGYLTRRGKPFSASAVRAMVDGPMPVKPSQEAKHDR